MVGVCLIYWLRQLTEVVDIADRISRPTGQEMIAAGAFESVVVQLYVVMSRCESANVGPILSNFSEATSGGETSMYVDVRSVRHDQHRTSGDTPRWMLSESRNIANSIGKQ